MTGPPGADTTPPAVHEPVAAGPSGIDALGISRRAALLFGIALVHRLVLALWTTTIATDGAIYLAMAEAFAQGRVEDALTLFRGIHPLYPLLVALIGSPLGSLEAAAYGLSVAAGAVAVVPLYLGVRLWWNDRVAFWTGLLYALHPVMTFEGSEVMTTSLFLAAFITSVTLIVFAFHRQSLILHLLAGISVGLCYLTRPEGVLLLPVYATAAALAFFRRLGPVTRGSWRLWGGVLSFLLTLAVVASPYLHWIHSRTGKWSFTARPSAGVLTGTIGSESVDLPPEPETPRAERPPEIPPPPAPLTDARHRSILEQGRRFAAALYGVLIPFLVAGLAFTPRAGGRWRVLWAPAALAVFTAVPALALHVATRGAYAVSHRYFLIAAVFLLPWSAAGLLLAADLITRRFSRLRVPAGSFLIVIVLAILVAKHAGPRRADEASFVEAGRWVRSHSEPRGRTAMVSREKLAYYAQARAVPLPSGEPAHGNKAQDYAAYLAVMGSKSGAGHLLLDEQSLRKLPTGLLESLERAGFRVEQRFPPAGETRRRANEVWIYRIP